MGRLSHGVFFGFALTSLSIILSLVSLSLGAEEKPVSIEFLFGDDEGPGDGFSYQNEQPSTPRILKNATKVCVQGIWALYTTENFGLKDTPNTVVYPYHGASKRDCNGNIGEVLKTIKSFRPLASKENIETYIKNYFLSPKQLWETPIPAGVRNKIKSLVINEGEVDGNGYILCNKDTKCICLKKQNGPFIIPDLDTFPKKDPIKGPLTRLVPVNSIDLDVECAQYTQPFVRSV